MDELEMINPDIELLDAPTFFELYRIWLQQNRLQLMEKLRKVKSQSLFCESAFNHFPQAMNLG
jgi:hypothetical protein